MVADVVTDEYSALFGASGDQQIVTFGTAHARDRSLVFLANSRRASSGRAPDNATNLNCDDLSLEAFTVDALGSQVTLDLFAAGEAVDHNWRVQRWRFPSSGDNEALVHYLEGSFAALSVDIVVGTTAAVSAADCVPVVCSQGVDDVARNFDRAICTAKIVVVGGDVVCRLERGDNTGTVEYTVQVVEFVGANWSVPVQNLEIDRASLTGNAGDVTLQTDTDHDGAVNAGTVDVGDWSQCMWFESNRSNAPSLDETPAVVHADGVATTAVHCRWDNSANSNNDVVVHVVKHADLAVTHFSDVTEGDNNESTLTITHGATVDTAEAGVVFTNTCNGSGTAYPRQFFDFFHASTTQITARRGRSGQALTWGAQVIDFSGVVSGGAVEVAGSQSVVTVVSAVADVGGVADVAGSPSVVSAVSAVADVGVTADVDGSPTVATAVSAVADVGVVTDVAGSPSVVSTVSAVADVGVTADVDGSQSVVAAVSAVADVGGAVDVAGSPSVVSAVSAVADVGGVADVDGSPSVVSAVSAVADVGGAVDVDGSPSVVSTVSAVGDIGSVPVSDIAGTPSVVAVVSAVGDIGADADVDGSPTVATVVSAVADVGAVADVEGSASVVAVVSAVGDIGGAGEVAGSPSVATAVSAVADVDGVADVAGSLSVVTAVSAVADVGVTADVDGSPSVVAVVSAVADVGVVTGVAGSASVVAVVAAVADVGGVADVAGSASVVSVVSAVGDAGGVTDVDGFPTLVAVVSDVPPGAVAAGNVDVSVGELGVGVSVGDLGPGVLVGVLGLDTMAAEVVG